MRAREQLVPGAEGGAPCGRPPARARADSARGWCGSPARFISSAVSRDNRRARRSPSSLARDRASPSSAASALAVGAARAAALAQRSLDEVAAFDQLERDWDAGRMLLRHLVAPAREQVAPGDQRVAIARVRLDDRARRASGRCRRTPSALRAIRRRRRGGSGARRRSCRGRRRRCRPRRRTCRPPPPWPESGRRRSRARHSRSPPARPRARRAQRQTPGWPLPRPFRPRRACRHRFSLRRFSFSPRFGQAFSHSLAFPPRSAATSGRPGCARPAHLGERGEEALAPPCDILVGNRAPRARDGGRAVRRAAFR